MHLAQTPPPPYYAVVFVAERARDVAGAKSEIIDAGGYGAMAEEMTTLAQQQEGFLGVDSAAESLNITVSYWRDLESIKKWKQEMRHRIAQKMGREKWYSTYKIRICKVEREYGYTAENESESNEHKQISPVTQGENRT